MVAACREIVIHRYSFLDVRAKASESGSGWNRHDRMRYSLRKGCRWKQGVWPGCYPGSVHHICRMMCISCRRCSAVIDVHPEGIHPVGEVYDGSDGTVAGTVNHPALFAGNDQDEPQSDRPESTGKKGGGEHRDFHQAKGDGGKYYQQKHGPLQGPFVPDGLSPGFSGGGEIIDGPEVTQGGCTRPAPKGLRVLRKRMDMTEV